MKKHIAPYWKAVAAFVAPGASLLVGALLPVSDGGTAITGAEWATAALTCVLTSGAVYRTENAERLPKPE